MVSSHSLYWRLFSYLGKENKVVAVTLSNLLVGFAHKRVVQGGLGEVSLVKDHAFGYMFGSGWDFPGLVREKSDLAKEVVYLQLFDKGLGLLMH